MEKSPAFSKARASGLTRALKLITRAFPGFADPIDFTNVTDLIGLYRVQTTIVKSHLLSTWKVQIKNDIAPNLCLMGQL